MLSCPNQGQAELGQARFQWDRAGNEDECYELKASTKNIKIKIISNILL